MQLTNTATKFARAICNMVGVELDEKDISLNKSEIETLRQAQNICERAERLLEAHYGADWIIDTENDFMIANTALGNILE